MTIQGIPPMELLALIVDHIPEIARELLGDRRTMPLTLWDHGDCDIYVFHTMGKEEREQITYTNKTESIS